MTEIFKLVSFKIQQIHWFSRSHGGAILGLIRTRQKEDVMSFIYNWKTVAYHEKTSEGFFSDNQGRLAAMIIRGAHLAQDRIYTCIISFSAIICKQFINSLGLYLLINL